jgi:hypothetical protein
MYKNSKDTDWKVQMPGKIFVDRESTIEISGRVVWVDIETETMVSQDDSNQLVSNLQFEPIMIELWLNDYLTKKSITTQNFNFCINLIDTDEVCVNTLKLKVTGLDKFIDRHLLHPALLIEKFEIESFSLIKLLGHFENLLVSNDSGAPATVLGQDCCQTITLATPIYNFLVENYKFIDH